MIRRLYDIHGVKLNGEEIRELGKEDYDGMTVIDIANSIERATSYHELVQMMRKIGIKQRVSACPKMEIGSHVYDDSQLKKALEESDSYREDEFTVVRTSPEGELDKEEYEVVGPFKTFDEALTYVGHEEIDDMTRDYIEEGMNIFYIILGLEVMDVTVY